MILFLLISLSISVMWSFSEIFRPIRNIISRIPYIRKPLICPECSSFWIGFTSSFLYNPIQNDINFFIVSNVLCGLITHLFAFFLYKKNIANEINFIK